MSSAGNGGGSFDPGIETGYLRRATREDPLDPEIGAEPFDPGEGAGYDDRRARRAARRTEREERRRADEERKRRDAEERRRRKELIARRGATATAAVAAAAIEPEPEPAEPEPLPHGADPEPEPEPAPVTELRGLRPQRQSLADRLERDREERRHAERERRARIERQREARARQAREERERRRRARAARLRLDPEAIGVEDPAPRATRHPRVTRAPRRRPVRRRAHRPVRRRTLVWPTAKAGLAVTLVLGFAAGLGSLAGLPVPVPDPSVGANSLLSSSSLFGVDPGTPTGLTEGFVFPVGGSNPPDYGDADARFGAPRAGHTHQGQDVLAKPGTPLYAVRDGVVIDGAGGRSFYAYGGGNDFVMYSPTDDRSYVYLHMLHPSPLHAGDRVHAGQQIGQVGCTGSCDGPHLHFEIRLGRIAYGHETKPIDPLPYLRQWDRMGSG